MVNRRVYCEGQPHTHTRVRRVACLLEVSVYHVPVSGALGSEVSGVRVLQVCLDRRTLQEAGGYTHWGARVRSQSWLGWRGLRRGADLMDSY